MNTRTTITSGLAVWFAVLACTDDDSGSAAPNQGGTGGAVANPSASGGAPGGASPRSGGAPNSTGGVSSGGGGTGGNLGATGGNGIDAGSNDSGAGGSVNTDGGATPNSVWSDLSVMAIVNPKDHGAVGDGTADDLAGLNDAVNALPTEGGIVYLPPGSSFKKTDLLIVTKPHVHFWSVNRTAELFQGVGGQRRHQSIICRNNTGCGFFGLKFRSDATARFDALEDNQISADHGSLVEVVGCEIDGSAAAGIFLYGSTEHYIEGNYVHHTWADHIHHTDGARQSWVWGNFIFNEDPSKGDDGVACVTYGPTNPLCGDMEWWRNTILHTGWGRGYSVIGGDSISIHHNWAIGVAGAGIIVASEPSYNSGSSHDISIANNYVYQCAHAIGHPGILVSGLNTAAAPLANIALQDNVSADTVSGQPYRAEGAYTGVTNVRLSSASADLPKPIPTTSDVRMADTSVLRTRDVSHVAAAFRPGLYRIHVQRSAAGSSFQQRFEYVVRGTDSDMTAFIAERRLAGDYISEQRSVAGTSYALVLSANPITIPSTIAGVDFRALRAGDSNGNLTWLWQRLDTGAY